MQGGWQSLVNSVEGGVARVELDGGEGGLTGGGSGISQGGSDGGGSSQGSGGSSHGGHGSSNGWSSSIGQSWGSDDSGVVEGKSSGGKSGEVESGSIRVGQSSDGGSGDHSGLLVSVTLLPLSVSGLQESQVGGLGLSHLRGVLDGLGGDSGEDGGDEGLGVEGGGDQRSDLGGGGGSGADWEVGAGNSEPVDRVGNIVDSLEETVGVNVLVGASGHTIGITGLKYQTELVAPVCSSDISQHLSTSRRAASMSERELSELILSVELG